MDSHLRTIRIEGYTLTTWDTYREDRGKTILRYRFIDPHGITLFEGEDFACSPLHAIDSDECWRGLLGFLTLRPGDTDDEYFEEYTAEQMAFAEGGDAEMLSVYVDEIPPAAFEV